MSVVQGNYASSIGSTSYDPHGFAGSYVGPVYNPAFLQFYNDVPHTGYCHDNRVIGNFRHVYNGRLLVEPSQDQMQVDYNHYTVEDRVFAGSIGPSPPGPPDEFYSTWRDRGLDQNSIYDFLGEVVP